MPRILPKNDASRRTVATSLRDFRDNPERLFFHADIAAAGGPQSYDGVASLIKAGKLPPPYVVGNRQAWEGRHLLRAFGAPEVIRGDEPSREGGEQAARRVGRLPHMKGCLDVN